MSTNPAYAGDMLRREVFAKRFERFILTEHEFVDMGLVVTLRAPFGAGKSKFIEMWTSDINERRKSLDSTPQAIVINAWESDYCGEPIVAIVASLIEALESRETDSAEIVESIKEALSDLGNFTMGLADGVASKVTGMSPLKAREHANKEKEKRQKAAVAPEQDLVRDFTRKREALKNLRAALETAFKADAPKAIIVIDELDRCRPDYSIAYLEAIKHLFNIHGIVFVLAVDESQLRSAVQVLFGETLNFDEYYRKFSHRTVALPPPSEEMSRGLIEAYLNRYLKKESKRWTAYDQGATEMVIDLIHSSKITPRQIQEAVRIIGHTFSIPENQPRRLMLSYKSYVIFLSVLRVWDAATYRQWVATTPKPGHLVAVLHNLFPATDRENILLWFEMLTVGLPKSEQLHSEISNELSRLGSPRKGEASEVQEIYKRWAPGIHPGTNLVKFISGRIDEVVNFIDPDE